MDPKIAKMDPRDYVDDPTFTARIKNALTKGWFITHLVAKNLLHPPLDHQFLQSSNACYYLDVLYEGKIIGVPNYFFDDF